MALRQPTLLMLGQASLAQKCADLARVLCMEPLPLVVVGAAAAGVAGPAAGGTAGSSRGAGGGGDRPGGALVALLLRQPALLTQAPEAIEAKVAGVQRVRRTPTRAGRRGGRAEGRGGGRMRLG